LSESRFDRTADQYVAAAREKDWSALVDFCRPQPADRALDVGAGPGLLSAALAPHVARAVALDPAWRLLEHAPEGVERVVGEAERMPFEDDEFDLVTVVNTLHHVADPRATLAEMVRVLAPGGRIVVQDYLADPDPEVAERWDQVERLRDPGHGRLPAASEVEERLSQLGLDEEDEQRWESTWRLEAWVEMASPPPDAVEEIRRLVGADSFSLTAWRGRFTSRL
jgi:ubiquinone/menaquinone biosynthesis C-methylase UbiE